METNATQSSQPDPSPYVHNTTYFSCIKQITHAMSMMSAQDIISAFTGADSVRTVPHSVRNEIGQVINDVSYAMLPDNAPLDALHKVMCALPTIIARKGSTTHDIKERLRSIKSGNAADLVSDAYSWAVAFKDKHVTPRPPLDDTGRSNMAGKHVRENEQKRASRALLGGMPIAPSSPANTDKWKSLHPLGDPFTDKFSDMVAASPPWPNRGDQAGEAKQITQERTPYAPPPGPWNTCNGAPQGSELLDPPPDLSPEGKAEAVSEEANGMVKAARALKEKSASGPYGFSVSFMKSALTSTRAMQTTDGQEQEVSIASPFARVLARWKNGQMPAWYRTHVFNCSKSLIFQKPPPSHSIRPTAVGFGGRRVVSKYMSRTYAPAIRNSMPRSQKGLDPKGTETIVHMQRAALDPDTEISHFAADEANAFNEFSREQALALAKAHWPPDLYEYIELIYGSPNKVVLGTDMVMADRGSTQGCAFGLALYALTSAGPMIKAAEAMVPAQPTSIAFEVGYADDFSTTAALPQSFAGMQAYVNWSKQAHKRFNSKKCKFYTPNGSLHGTLVTLARDGSRWHDGSLEIPLTVVDGTPFVIVDGDTLFEIIPPAGIHILGSPVGSPVFVRDALEDAWSDDQVMLRRLRGMEDVQSAVWALRTLALSRPVYAFRTIPPSLAKEYATKWDEHVCEIMSHLMLAPQMTPSAIQLLQIKPKHGGVGIPSMVTLSSTGYPSSLAAAIWTVSLPPFLEAREFLSHLPPIQEDEHQRGDDLTTLRDLELARAELDHQGYSPTRALIAVWRALSTQSPTDLQRIFRFQFDPDEAPSLDPSLFAGQAATMKIQREVTTAASARLRTATMDTHVRTLEQLHDVDQHLSADYRHVVRQLVHASATSWKHFYALQPWIANFRVKSDQFRALIRFHLVIRSHKSVATGMSMDCNCRNKAAPRQTYTDPDYHGISCGYAALIRKRTHNHIATKTTHALNQMGVYRAKEPLNPDAPDMGKQPDVYLTRNPTSDPLPIGSPAYESIDVTITQLVQSSDYRCKPDRLLRRTRKRPMDSRYAFKVGKHGPTCLPLVLDLSANFHGKSLSFLEEAKGERGSPTVLFFRKECAAAICRMLGSMYQRNIRQRTEHLVPNVELTEAMATFVAEYEAEEALRAVAEDPGADELTNVSSNDPIPVVHDEPPFHPNIAIDSSP